MWEVDCTWDGGVAAASSDGVVRCVIERFVTNRYWKSVESDHVMDAISVRVVQEDVYALKSHPFLPSTVLCGFRWVDGDGAIHRQSRGEGEFEEGVSFRVSRWLMAR